MSSRKTLDYDCKFAKAMSMTGQSGPDGDDL